MEALPALAAAANHVVSRAATPSPQGATVLPNVEAWWTHDRRGAIIATDGTYWRHFGSRAGAGRRRAQARERKTLNLKERLERWARWFPEHVRKLEMGEE